MRKLLIYFDIKKYVQPKNISYDHKFDQFL